MAAELRSEHPDLEIQFIESSGGVFEVVYEGKLIFSKLETHRFPEKGEVGKLLAAAK